MILDKTIKVKVNGKMVKKYKELGFDVKQYDIINLPVEYLSKYSHQKIRCACDICGEEKEVKYNNYCRYIDRDPNNEYTCKKCNLGKRKNTCLEKYGVDFVAKLETSKEKAKETMKENGTQLFFCNPDFKKKMIELYGVANASYSEELKEKRVNTYIERFGVENPSQNEEIHRKQHGFTLKKHKNGMFYRGTYEKDFIDFSIDNNIKIENFKGTIEYKFEGKSRKYFPDFFIKSLNLIVEIKSKWTYDVEKEQNELKRKAAISNGFNFIFIINKDYKDISTYHQNHLN